MLQQKVNAGTTPPDDQWPNKQVWIPAGIWLLWFGVDTVPSNLFDESKTNHEQ